MHIEDQTLQSPVSGVNLAPGSFGDQLSAEPTLLALAGSLLRAPPSGRQGQRVWPIDGNVFRMPGAFLVRGSEILWSHKFKHSATARHEPSIGRLFIVVSLIGGPVREDF